MLNLMPPIDAGAGSEGECNQSDNRSSHPERS
jgi:hypothetical protein